MLIIMLINENSAFETLIYYNIVLVDMFDLFYESNVYKIYEIV